MMNISVTFDLNGEQFTGELSEVMGNAAANVFHLMVNKYYWGRLRMDREGNWVFDPTPSTTDLQQMADYFGRCVVAAADSPQ